MVNYFLPKSQVKTVNWIQIFALVLKHFKSYIIVLKNMQLLSTLIFSICIVSDIDCLDKAKHFCFGECVDDSLFSLDWQR